MSVLTETQSGFQYRFTCATAIFTIVDDIISELDKGKATDLCLLDFSKAFDTFDHRLLVPILHFVVLKNLTIQLLICLMSQIESNLLKSIMDSSDSVPM